MKTVKKTNLTSINPGIDKDANERLLVLEALRKNQWNITKAAQSSKMSRTQFVRILKKFGFRDVL
jgi:transcriptional regulator of acetoin/glycerol metabolism